MLIVFRRKTLMDLLWKAGLATVVAIESLPIRGWPVPLGLCRQARPCTSIFNHPLHAPANLSGPWPSSSCARHSQEQHDPAPCEGEIEVQAGMRRGAGMVDGVEGKT